MTADEFTISTEASGLLRTIWDAGHRRLPPRYETDAWDRRLRRRLDELLRPGVAVLDLGAGRRPTLPPADRPAGIHYVGLDVDAAELARAAAGSYDETVVAAAEEQVDALVGRFDFVVSFFALEHVRSTSRTLENAQAYLKDGGTLLAVAAGANSPFAIANRLLPGALVRRILAATQRRRSEAVFRARYDACTAERLLEALGDGWSMRLVEPAYTGAGYALFSRVATAAYIGYEEWLCRTDRRELAPAYFVEATK